MKKPGSKIKKTRSAAVAVSALLGEPGILKSLVERLAYRHEDIGFSHEAVPFGWQAVEISSLEGYASGDLVLSDINELVNVPFDTCFLFTCIKGRKGNYDLAWSCSLS